MLALERGSRMPSTPQTIPELYEALMREINPLKTGVAGLKTDMELVRRTLESLDVRVENLESRLLAPEERTLPSSVRSSSAIAMAAKGGR